MAILIKSTRDSKDLTSLITESADLNPVDCNYFSTKNAEVYKSTYANGLWKKEIIVGHRRIIKYSAKIDGRIVFTEIYEHIVPLENIKNQVMDMFGQYSKGLLWVD